MPKIVLDRSGDVRKGVFYRFNVQAEDAIDDTDRTSEWIVVPRTPTEMELALKGIFDGDQAYMWAKLTDAAKRVETSDCPLEKEHMTYGYFERSKGEAYVGKRVSPFIPANSDTVFVLSDELRRHVEATKLRGARIEPLKLTRGDDGPEVKGFWTLQFVGKAKLRFPKFIDVPNKCPHCGKTKIMCEGCGEWYAYCKACENYMVIIESQHKDKDDKQIPFEPDIWRVIMGKTWDGNDLFQARGEPYASQRFIDWLLRIHAAPFYAEPVYFCVDGMSDQQKKWLDDLQKPFEV